MIQNKLMHPALTSVKFWLTLFAAAVFGAGIVSRVMAAATVEITNPTAGQTIEGDKFELKLATKGFKLVDHQQYPKNGYNQGHLHLWLDQENPTKSSAIKISTDSYTFENVKPGDHTLLVEVVNNDHSSLNPKVVTSVDFKTVAPKVKQSTNMLMISIFAFLFLCVALYFLNLTTKTKPSTHTSSTKSSRKASKKK